jgi:hypothetical protein
MALERSFFRAYYIVDAGSRRGDRCRTSSPLSSTGKPRRRSTRIYEKTFDWRKARGNSRVNNVVILDSALFGVQAVSYLESRRE